MLIQLFAILLLVAIIFFIIGFQYENYPVFMVSGIIFLLLSIGIFLTGITIKTGEEIVEINPCDINLTCFQQEDYNITTNINYVYSSSDGIANKTIGSLFLALSFFAFGCALVYATPKKDRENNPDHQEWNYY